MSIAKLIRDMTDAGAPPEAIALAVEAVEAVQNIETERKAKRAAQKHKERHGEDPSLATVARLGTDLGATVDPMSHPGSSPKEKSPTPPKEITPSQSSLRSDTQRAKAIFATVFWPIYPKRRGSNPKQPAEDKFIRLVVRAGIDPYVICDGAKRYGISVADADPQFTKMAVTWLNQSGWQDDYSQPARAGPQRRSGHGGMADLSRMDEPEIFDDPGNHTRNGAAQTPEPSDQGRSGFGGTLPFPALAHGGRRVVDY